MTCTLRKCPPTPSSSYDMMLNAKCLALSCTQTQAMTSPIIQPPHQNTGFRRCAASGLLDLCSNETADGVTMQSWLSPSTAELIQLQQHLTDIPCVRASGHRTWTDRKVAFDKESPSTVCTSGMSKLKLQSRRLPKQEKPVFSLSP